MISPSRDLSFDILSRIEAGTVFSDDALNSNELSRLETRDRHLTTEIVYGTLRWKLLLDHALSGVVIRAWQEVHPGIRIILRMSLYQMWRMDRIPDHALVDDAVELAKKRFKKPGLAAFVNGVLRHLARHRPWNSDGYGRDFAPWIWLSLPQWLWDRWRIRFGDETAAKYAASLNQPPRCTLHIPGTPGSIATLPEGAVVSEIVPGAVFAERPPRESGFRMQDEASQLIPHLLGVSRGGRVWDACAAPGGKSEILIEQCGDAGLVVSSDLRWQRARRLAGTFGSAPLRKALVVVADAMSPPPFRVSFDAVLADVPCSGLGTLRRNPEIKWRFRSEELPVLQRKQISILQAVSTAVRPGGLLAYSTCSTETEENEQVVDAFLKIRSDFHLVRPSLPPGIGDWIDERGLVRTFPSTRLWDGFFAAIMLRQS